MFCTNFSQQIVNREYVTNRKKISAGYLMIIDDIETKIEISPLLHSKIGPRGIPKVLPWDPKSICSKTSYPPGYQ